MRFVNVTMKLGKQRKAYEWTVYPVTPENREIKIQCDKAMARFNIDTGAGACCFDSQYGYGTWTKLQATPQQLEELRAAHAKMAGRTEKDGSFRIFG